MMPPMPMITLGSISGMTGLKERPVYFVRLNGSQQPNVVVKGEPAGASLTMRSADAVVSIAWGSKLMKNVQSDQINVKVMTEAEVTAFKSAALRSLPRGTNQFENVFAKDRRFNWVKMPYVNDLNTAQFTVEQDWMGDGGRLVHSDIATPELIMKALSLFSCDNVWYDLGKALAVDIFLGNTDRFDL